MSTNVEKYIGEAMLRNVPGKKLSLVIRDKSVTTDKIDDKAVTPEKLADSIAHDVLKPMFASITQDLQNQIDSLPNGVAVSSKFGDNPHIGVSQKTLTQAINQIWNKIADITGQLPNGIQITFNPEYVLSDAESEVVMTATAEDGIFEDIRVYGNGELLTSRDDIGSFTETFSINETTEFKVVATVLGMTYTQSKTIEKFYPFFIGSGSTWADAIKTENLKKYTGNIDGEYNIRVDNTGDRMFIVIPMSIKEQLEIATMSGFEIPFDVTTDSKYVVYTSRNTYRSGVYTINLR